MKSNHTSSAAQALYSVFVRPALCGAAPSRPLLLQHASRAPLLHPSRLFSTSPARLVKTRAPEQRAHKWDEEIMARVVYLVDPVTNKLEDQPRTRFDVLNTIDRNTHRLVQLSADEPENRGFMPVCKIVGKKEQYAADRERKKQQKEKKTESARVNSIKTLELNWAIDANDLGHRLERVAEFLADGRRVEIVLAAKKQGRKATKQECEGVMKRIYGVVDDVPGSRELKRLEGKLGGFASLVLQGRAPGQSKEGGE